MTTENLVFPKQQSHWKAARFIALGIFVVWLLLIAAYPSLPLLFVGLAWVVFVRSNRTAEKITAQINLVHEEAVKDRLLIMTFLLTPPDPENPDVREMAAEFAARLERMAEPSEPGASSA